MVRTALSVIWLGATMIAIVIFAIYVGVTVGKAETRSCPVIVQGERLFT